MLFARDLKEGKGKAIAAATAVDVIVVSRLSTDFDFYVALSPS